MEILPRWRAAARRGAESAKLLKGEGAPLSLECAAAVCREGAGGGRGSGGDGRVLLAHPPAVVREQVLGVLQQLEEVVARVVGPEARVRVRVRIRVSYPSS